MEFRASAIADRPVRLRRVLAWLMLSSCGIATLGSVPRAQMPGMPVEKTGTGLIIGRVIDGTTERPIAGATVSIPQRLSSLCLTDADGRFVMTGLPADSLHVIGTKDGYAPGGLGQNWIGISSLDDVSGVYGPAFVQRMSLKDGERRDDIVIRLWKYGVITGHVTDDAGDPVVGITVQAWPRVMAGGRPDFNGVTPYNSQTDDRGAFRIPRLLPGDYVVAVPAESVTVPKGTTFPKYATTPANVEIVAALGSMDLEPSSAPTNTGMPNAVSSGSWVTSASGQVEPLPTAAGWRGYATTFSPAARSAADATVINITPSAERNADVALRPENLYAVNGSVVDASGRPRAIGLRLVSGDNPVGVALSDADGRFLFSAVPAGSYRIEIAIFPEPAPRPNVAPGYLGSVGKLAEGLGSRRELDVSPWTHVETEWADVPVNVNAGGASGILVTLRTGARVSGRLVFDGSPPQLPPLRGPIAPPPIAFKLVRADGQPSSTELMAPMQVDANGNLLSVGYPPGRYLLREMPLLPAGWSIESAMVGGRNILVSPLELGDQAVDGLVVTLTKTPSVVTGQVRRAGGAPDPGTAVIVFPTDRTHWVDYGPQSRDVVAQRVTTDGHFTVTGLPPGDYRIVAVADDVRANGLDPTLLDALSRVADHVTVVARAQQTVNLVTQVVR